MRRKPPSGDEAIGEESFLDVVANLVGILLIFLVIVGARAQNAQENADEARREDSFSAPSPSSEEPAAAELRLAEERAAAEAALAEANRAESEVRDAARQIYHLEPELASRFHERSELQTLVTALEMDLAKQTNQLDEDARRKWQLERDLEQAREQLAEIERARFAIEGETAAPEVIKHYPTPLAQTVFGREEHFRLSGGRLAYVPLNEFVGRLQAEAPTKLWKLKDAPQITETLGPVDGFRMQYTLKRIDFAVNSRSGGAVRQAIELDRFVLVPVNETLGEPVQEALNAGSNFWLRVDGFTPNNTTITVWTYPDSFAEFRAIKESLLKRGFSTAARPMPHDMPISGSPQGTKSAAQ